MKHVSQHGNPLKGGSIFGTRTLLVIVVLAAVVVLGMIHDHLY